MNDIWIIEKDRVIYIDQEDLVFRDSDCKGNLSSQREVM